MGFGAVTFAAPGSAAPGNAAPRSTHITGQIIVKFGDDRAAAGVLRQHGLSEGAGIGSTRAQLIKVPAGKELQLIEALNRNPAVEYAEPDELVTATTTDEYFPRQYALENTGQTISNTAEKQVLDIGTPGADVQAVNAWTVTKGPAPDPVTGSPSGIRVAILDSGVTNDNGDITGKIVAQENFTDGETGDDNYGHGTHVAGIVAAATDNGIGVAGVCPECRILDAKVLNDSGSGSTSSISRGIDWAADNHAKVINMSLGQRVSSRTLEAAVNDAWSRNVVIVAAAGNGGTQAKIYPGAYPNVIAVAATDNKDAKASFSTFGKWVDVAAPGVSVYSTFPNHPFVLGTQNGRSMGYDVASGTSMASPIVAGVAALVWSTPAGTDNAAVRTKIELTARKIAGTGTNWAHGRVNAHDAVKPPPLP